MADEWIECKLADACSSIDYGLTASAVNVPDNPRFLRITDIVNGAIDWNTVPYVVADQEITKKYQLDDGDIVIARTGASTGSSAYIKAPPVSVFASYLVRLKARSDFDSRYIGYYLKSEAFWSFIRAVLGDKSAQPNASASTMTQAPFRAPKRKDEQQAISHILGTLDDKIELNRKMNETLESMARAIFRSWFIDFDPVRAKAEGRDTGLPKHIADIFPDSFEESELGERPRGWEVKTVGDISNVVGGSTPSTKEPAYWDDGNHYWATPKDLSGLSVPVILKTERRITNAGLEQISSGLLPIGTVLLSSRAPIGYLAIAEVPVAINQGFIAMKPMSGISNIFLLFWSEWAHDEILSRANGSTFLEISKSNFRPIPLVKPLQPIMKFFDLLTRPLYRKIVMNQHQSQVLITLRDTLLPKLITGELRIKDVMENCKGGR